MTCRADVDRAYRLALDSGGISEGSPGLRPEYHEHYYADYFKDPEENKTLHRLSQSRIVGGLDLVVSR